MRTACAASADWGVADGMGLDPLSGSCDAIAARERGAGRWRPPCQRCLPVRRGSGAVVCPWRVVPPLEIQHESLDKLAIRSLPRVETSHKSRGAARRPTVLEYRRGPF